jgi:ketosteroid isomerase-like protein
MPPIQSERFALDLHDKKISDVMSLYTADAEFIDPDGKTYKGVDEIRKMYEQITSTYDSDLHLKMVSFQQTHAFGIEHGTYTETMRTRATGATQQISGTYVFLHERQPNGDWLIARQTWTQKPIK